MIQDGLRVYQVANEIGLSAREALDRLKELGHPAKSHMSPIEPRLAAELRAKFRRRPVGAVRGNGGPGGPAGARPPEAAGADAAKKGEAAAADKGARKKKPEKGRGREDDARRRRGGRKFHERPDAAVATLHRQRKAPQPPKRPTHFTVTPPVTVKELSALMGVKANILIGKLMEHGTLATLNDIVPEEAILKMAEVFRIRADFKKAPDLEALIQTRAEARPSAPGGQVLRSPVVTFMGHVDHGKTSLLDAIRKTEVAKGEAGGITQHIGAYLVHMDGGRTITFLDTPGHEAFTNMRARGAQVTDLVVLVVAADDGMMPQTEEAAAHARAAGVPIIVAINKVDKPTANLHRVMQQLTTLNLQPEKWGGKTSCVEVSALTLQGIPDLLEAIALEAEILELKADPAASAEGTVLEAFVSGGRGVVAHLLVRRGTLKRGDTLLSGLAYGRVRSLEDEHGRSLKEAGPSTPVKVAGLSELPENGAPFQVVDDFMLTRRVAEERERRLRVSQITVRQKVSLQDLFRQVGQGSLGALRVVLKADVKGSLEVLSKALLGLSRKEIQLRIMLQGVGGITAGDVLLADASNAVIIGFNVRPEEKARTLADEKGIDIKCYAVIYNLVDEVKKAMEGKLAPDLKEVELGRAHVRQVFKLSKFGTVAGSMVVKGKITRQSKLRLVRDGVLVHTGRVGSLKKVKEDASEVAEGFECGIKIEGYEDIKAGDVIEAFIIEKVARKLD